MEEILYRLILHIKEGMPSLSMVDEDYGQLEAIDKDEVQTYPVTFPAVLIDAPETDWSNLSLKSQKGKIRIVVRLIIDCYDDTHAGSDTEDRILERAGMVGELHRLLQCFRPLDDGEMIREKSRFYTWSHGIKIYETEYSVSATEIIPEKLFPFDGHPKVTVQVKML